MKRQKERFGFIWRNKNLHSRSTKNRFFRCGIKNGLQTDRQTKYIFTVWQTLSFQSRENSLSVLYLLSLIFRSFFDIEPFQSCFRNNDECWGCFVSYRSIENFKRYNVSSGHVCQFLFSERWSDHFRATSTRAPTGELAHRNLRVTFDCRVSNSQESSSLGLFIPKWLGRLDQSALCEISKHWFWP